MAAAGEFQKSRACGFHTAALGCARSEQRLVNVIESEDRDPRALALFIKASRCAIGFANHRVEGVGGIA